MTDQGACDREMAVALAARAGVDARIVRAEARDARVVVEFPAHIVWIAQGAAAAAGVGGPKGTWTGLAEAWPELAEQIAAVQRDLDATPIDNMPRRGRLTWTIWRGAEAPGRDRRSARARQPMTARLALIGAPLVFATSCHFNESRWVLRAWAPPARCSLAVRMTSRLSRPACPAYRRLHEVVIQLSSGRV